MTAPPNPSPALWKTQETDANLPLMARTLGISETIARVMANRGIRSKKAALNYLSACFDSLRDPFLMRGAAEAVRLLSAAAEKKEKIIIYGDYDADGVMATVILYKTLVQLGADVDYYIPLRAEEGYGLNLSAVRRMGEAGVRWMVTVDNGISALPEVDEANRLGMKVLVIDHHEPGEQLPAAKAIVDPKQPECDYPFKALCAAGLAFKLAGALYACHEEEFTSRDEFLALAAIATVCDIVELQDENRVLVKCGLDVLNKNKLINPGLGSLIVRRGYLDKPLDAFAAGFVLGPCLNAAGRLGSAGLSVELLLASSEDLQKRADLADKLAGLNEERKTLTADGVEHALQTLAAYETLDKVLVLTDPEMHESVAGIVAGRVKETVNRPTLVLTRGGTSADMYKGSGRSIEGYHLFDALYRRRHLLDRFGGHAMAAGLTIAEANIPALREGLNADCVLTEDDFRAVLYVDGVLAVDDVTLALSRELARLAPFGRGNREPLFAAYGLKPENIRVMDEKSTLIFTFAGESGRKVKAVCFGLNEKYAQERGAVNGGAFTMDVVYGVETNAYNGAVSAQMKIRDFRIR